MYISLLKNNIEIRVQWNALASATKADFEADIEEMVRKKYGYTFESERSPLSADADICILRKSVNYINI